MGKEEMHAGFWWGKPERMKPLGRPRRRWEDEINTNIQEVGWGMACTGLIWLRIGTVGGPLVNVIMKLRGP